MLRMKLEHEEHLHCNLFNNILVLTKCAHSDKMYRIRINICNSRWPIIYKINLIPFTIKVWYIVLKLSLYVFILSLIWLFRYYELDYHGLGWSTEVYTYLWSDRYKRKCHGVRAVHAGSSCDGMGSHIHNILVHSPSKAPARKAQRTETHRVAQRPHFHILPDPKVDLAPPLAPRHRLSKASAWLTNCTAWKCP